jgi:pimeloyl-ACP methyl ester carboxylesterase
MADKVDPGAVLLALHSSASSGRQWAAYRALLPEDITLHTPDLLGCEAGAVWPTGAAVTLQDEAQRIVDHWPDAPGGVHLIGHSYGGAVALQIALLWPERLRSLTLYEPVRFALLRNDGDGALWRDIVSTAQHVRELAQTQGLRAAAEAFVDYWSGSGTWLRLPAKQQEGIAARMPKVSAEFGALFNDTLPLEAYGRLAMPLRLLHGSRSPRPARRVLELLAAACPAATTVGLDGLGHMGPLENPARVAPRLYPPPA